MVTSSDVYILCIGFILELLRLVFEIPACPPCLFTPTNCNRCLAVSLMYTNLDIFKLSVLIFLMRGYTHEITATLKIIHITMSPRSSLPTPCSPSPFLAPSSSSYRWALVPVCPPHFLECHVRAIGQYASPPPFRQHNRL